jgi:hypothetical protein
VKRERKKRRPIARLLFAFFVPQTDFLSVANLLPLIGKLPKKIFVLTCEVEKLNLLESYLLTRAWGLVGQLQAPFCDVFIWAVE